MRPLSSMRMREYPNSNGGPLGLKDKASRATLISLKFDGVGDITEGQ